MPKQKHEPVEAGEPAAKRPRAPINFSIEAIMKPHQLHQGARQQQPAANEYDASPDGSLSPANSQTSGPGGGRAPTSGAGSRSASPDPCSPASSASLSFAGSSRASTPISPGCHSSAGHDELAAAPDARHAHLGAHLAPLAGSRLAAAAKTDTCGAGAGGHQRPGANNNGAKRHSAGSCSSADPWHQHQHQEQHQQKQHNNKQQHQQQPAGSSAPASARLNQVECVLDNKDMWDKFHSLNTEMIITKTGRRMFPVMKVQFHNLDPSARYAVSMDIVPVDNKRYRYAYHKSCWQVAGKADPSAEPRLYAHPDSPFNGDLLSRQVISFEKVKLTNNEADKSGHIILNSMHKYQPRVHLIELKQTPVTNSKSSTSPSDQFQHHHHQHHQHQHQNQNQNQNQIHQSHQNHSHHQLHQSKQQAPQLDIEGYRTFVFPETVFTAVTAYQNQLITKMKIDKNPFAKGFRDSSRLSDLDRSDPFDYMGPLGSGPGTRFAGQPGVPGSLEAAAAAAAAGLPAHMDAYQLLASAANNPWYSAAAVAAAAGQAANPFGSVGAGACSTAQAAQQLQATQMWLAAFSACLNGGAGGPSAPAPPIGNPFGAAMLQMAPGGSPHLAAESVAIGAGPDKGGQGPDSRAASSANSSGTST